MCEVKERIKMMIKTNGFLEEYFEKAKKGEIIIGN